MHRKEKVDALFENLKEQRIAREEHIKEEILYEKKDILAIFISGLIVLAPIIIVLLLILYFASNF